MGAAEVGDGAGARARTRARRPRPRGRSSGMSASASSGCCASSRSWRSAPGRAAARSTRSTIEELSASSAERKAWSLADALLAGDAARRRGCSCALREQGERVPGLLYWMGSRIRAGPRRRASRSTRARRRLRSSAACGCRRKAADRLIADARRSGVRPAASRDRADRRPRARLARRRTRGAQ